MEKRVIEDMEHIVETLTSWLVAETACGMEKFHTQSAGEVSDIIKDMKESIKECYEACYYKTVIEAMEEGGSPAYGYNHWHMPNGEFARRGTGHEVRGYMDMPYMDQGAYVEAYLNDPDFRNKMMEHKGSSRHGEVYDKYSKAKRHYTSSRSLKDKEEMEKHSMNYMDDTLRNMKTMWQEADPSLKAKMKKDFGEEIAEFLEG